MSHVRVPVTLFNAICELAAAAPVPYLQSQSVWKAIEQLAPEPEDETAKPETVDA